MLRNEVDPKYITEYYKLHQQKQEIERKMENIKSTAEKDLLEHNRREMRQRRFNPLKANLECIKGCATLFPVTSDPILYRKHLENCQATLLPIGFTEALHDPSKTTPELRDKLMEQEWIDKFTLQLTAFGREAIKLLPRQSTQL